MKTFFATIAATLLACSVAHSADSLGEGVIAKGKGVTVTQDQLDDAFIAYKASLAARNQNIPESMRAEVEAKLLDKLIVTQIMMQRATPEDKEKGSASAEKISTDAEKRFSSPELFKQQLLASGLTYKEFKEKLLEQAICEQVLEREVKPTINITDADVKKYYDENPTRFEQPEMVRASHILISTVNPNTRKPLPADEKQLREKKINDLRARVMKGEDFAKLAKEYSDDLPSKEKGGEYTFARGQMVKPFELAAFNLKTNEVSQIVESPFGYHIIKLHEKIPPKKLEFSAVSKDIREGLIQKELQAKMPEYFEKLKKEAGVELTKK